MARPSTRTKGIETAIIEGICNGQSLPVICDGPNMPTPGTVISWIAGDQAKKQAKPIEDGEPFFCDRYKAAVGARLAVIAEEILAISDDGRNDTYKDADGSTRVDYDNIQRAKLRVDSRKWLLTKLDAKRYGDKPAAEVNVSNHVHNHISAERQKEWHARREAALAKR